MAGMCIHPRTDQADEPVPLKKQSLGEAPEIYTENSSSEAPTNGDEPYENPKNGWM